MPISYLYIDDEPNVLPFVERVIAVGDLCIDCVRPEEFREQAAAISERKPDGLILDLRLDGVPNANGVRVGYRALSLAQEARTRMTEGSLDPMPIVLWSVDAKMKESYEPDSTGHDLFDATYQKSEVSRDARRVSTELASLVTGYRFIVECCGDHPQLDTFVEILGLRDESLMSLDPRVGGKLRTSGEWPAHDFARGVRELIDLPGPLISEPIVAARLGVDPLSEGWSRLLEAVGCAARYQGAFCDGWPRWWAWALLHWWETEISNSNELRWANARQRVELLESKGFSGLRPATGKEGQSTTFWTVCAATDVPLDPEEGVLADIPQARVWHEGVYVTVESVVERRALARGLHVHPLERDRIARLIDDARQDQS